MLVLARAMPDYQGKADAMLEYRLSNGQHDVYPASWALAGKPDRQGS